MDWTRRGGEWACLGARKDGAHIGFSVLRGIPIVGEPVS